MKKIFIIFIMLLISMILVNNIVSAIDTLYERNFSQDTSNLSVYSSNWRAMGFTVGTSGSCVNYTIHNISLLVCRVGTPNRCYVSIYYCLAGIPNGTVLGTSWLNANSFGLGYTWQNWSFSEGIVYKPHARYIFVVNCSGTSSANCVKFRYYNGNAYSGDSESLSMDSGNTWVFHTFDYTFSIYGNPVTSPSYTIHQYENTENITGSHTCLLNSTGFYSWYNGSGNTTSIVWSNNHINTTWTHLTQLLTNNSWHIYDNDTGNLTGNGTGNYTVSINLSSLEGLGFGMNWTGGYNSTNTNITFNVSKNMNLLGVGSVLSMIVEYDMNQFGLMILMIVSFFFLIIGLLAKDNKFGGFLLIFDGVLLMELFIALLVTFGAVWIFISPGFILIGLLVLFYGIFKLGGKK